MIVNFHIYNSTPESRFIEKIFQYALCKAKITYTKDCENIITFSTNNIDVDMVLELSKKYPNEIFFFSYTSLEKFNIITNVVISNGEFLKNVDKPMFPNGAVLIPKDTEN